MFEPIVGIKLLQKLKKFDTFYCIKLMLSICIRTSIVIQMKHLLNFETP